MELKGRHSPRKWVLLGPGSIGILVASLKGVHGISCDRFWARAF